MQPALPACLTPPAPLAQVGATFPATVFTLINVIMGAGYVSIPFACRCVCLRLTTESVSLAEPLQTAHAPALCCTVQAGWLGGAGSAVAAGGSVLLHG